MKKENTSTRLKKLMNDRHLKQVDILNATTPYCKTYDVKMNKSDLSQYVSGKVEPNQDKLFVLSRALRVNVAWLMGFDVPMVIQESSENLINNDHFQTQDERELVLSYRKLNEQNKKKCSIYTNTLLTNQRMEEELMPNAAHESRKPYTAEERQADEDMLD